MQDQVRLDPDDEDVTTLVCCDVCNPDQDPFSETGSVYYGTGPESIQDGWQERDFGFICDLCQLQEARVAEYESGANNLAEALSLLTTDGKKS